MLITIQFLFQFFVFTLKIVFLLLTSNSTKIFKKYLVFKINTNLRVSIFKRLNNTCPTLWRSPIKAFKYFIFTLLLRFPRLLSVKPIYHTSIPITRVTFIFFFPNHFIDNFYTAFIRFGRGILFKSMLIL